MSVSCTNRKSSAGSVGGQHVAAREIAAKKIITLLRHMSMVTGRSQGTTQIGWLGWLSATFSSSLMAAVTIRPTGLPLR